MALCVDELPGGFGLVWWDVAASASTRSDCADFHAEDPLQSHLVASYAATAGARATQIKHVRAHTRPTALCFVSLPFSSLQHIQRDVLADGGQGSRVGMRQ